MEVNDRIKNIGEYFSVFNVQDGAVCVGINLPEKWTLFDVNTICSEFHVQIKAQNGVTFFLCDINDGFDPVFDAIDFIIKQNKSLEEKTNLLKEKVEELRVLFEQESLDKLRTLQFKFEDVITQPIVGLPINIKEAIENEKDIQEKNDGVVKQLKNSESDKTKKASNQGRKKKKNDNDSSLMNFVKNTLENE